MSQSESRRVAHCMYVEIELKKKKKKFFLILKVWFYEKSVKLRQSPTHAILSDVGGVCEMSPSTHHCTIYTIRCPPSLHYLYYQMSPQYFCIGTCVCVVKRVSSIVKFPCDCACWCQCAAQGVYCQNHSSAFTCGNYFHHHHQLD